jgi:hypothetical protein
MDRILPTDLLGPTIVGAVLNDFAEVIDLDRGANKKERDGWWHRYVLRRVAMMLDWFIRQHPESAHAYIGDVTRAAHGCIARRRKNARQEILCATTPARPVPRKREVPRSSR